MSFKEGPLKLLYFDLAFDFTGWVDLPEVDSASRGLPDLMTKHVLSMGLPIFERNAPGYTYKSANYWNWRTAEIFMYM